MLKVLLLGLVSLLVGFGAGVISSSQLNSIEDLTLGRTVKIVNKKGKAGHLVGCTITVNLVSKVLPSLLTPQVFSFPKGILCGEIKCEDESQNKPFECIDADAVFKTQKQKKEE